MHFCNGLVTKALNIFQIIDTFKRTVFAAVIEDGLCFCRADTLDAIQFIGISNAGIKGNGAAVATFITQNTNYKPLESMKRKLAVTVTQTRNNRLSIFNHGNTGAAVRASSAQK